MKRLALAVLVLGSLTFAPTVLASHSAFTGLWTSTDLDGSTQLLRVGQGDEPRVTYQDFYASVCDIDDSPSTRWVAAGVGDIDGASLEVHFFKSGCGTFSMGGYDSCCWVYDAGSDTLWDGFVTWYRAN